MDKGLEDIRRPMTHNFYTLTSTYPIYFANRGFILTDGDSGTLSTPENKGLKIWMDGYIQSY